MPSVVAEIVHEIEEVFQTFNSRFDFENVSQEDMINHAITFLCTSTASGIYYGNYITAENDEILHSVRVAEPGLPEPPVPIKKKSKKK